MCGLFPCIPILGERGAMGWFRLKSVNKCVSVIVLQIALLPVKSIFINVKKGMSELWRWLAAKHTTSTNILNHFSFY